MWADPDTKYWREQTHVRVYIGIFLILDKKTSYSEKNGNFIWDRTGSNKNWSIVFSLYTEYINEFTSVILPAAAPQDC